MPPTKPTSLFIKRFPADWENKPDIVSALQAYETSLVLVAYGRFPHALTNCVSAIEGLLKAVVPNTKGKRLFEVFEEAAKLSSRVDAFSKPGLTELRVARNDFIHSGFSPEDDGKAVDLLVGVGFPFFELCLNEFCSYDIAASTDGEIVIHLNVAQSVHKMATSSGIARLGYCIDSLGHLIRLSFAKRDLSDWAEIADHDDQTGNKFFRLKERKDRLDLSEEMTWLFDCPVCGGFECNMVELGYTEDDGSDLTASAMRCAECDFKAGPTKPFMCEVLMADQVEATKDAIRIEYGLLKDPADEPPQ
ncbi:hypothetical protein [Hyphomonas sp.]|uniref:hypothetical protein n=1 Tax=Hyphomonas sp. TaxID=87 RepID=UPI0025C31B7A|nr:hypothetical protein [Hyphomonas sp.]